ncbi:monooxygenase FAD-binding [Catenulispora acidiphila DSM 44928]|uniref:Monooxygenase FAD-binding n=1 Tax=Catenulispora acidiphila (strain DSM 44928 / JCM 14897 / NBRC 102108 / NRRL B-24433 / ID139908) TaxID=479433 RepID=C7QK58_CATAD|nr:FAD-dependent monooxygenase [Catenulispora acidiphila]ACU75132.1 monooxygenase FAD-binding [Catenulispora acidiphila DSM 44928]
MPGTKVLISGAGIGGPALAGWLGRNGFEVTVVEKAPGIRPGGQAVDFKGRTHREVLTRMGVLDEIHARQTSKTDWRLIDETERVKAVIPGEFLGGDVEILRGDLADILHRSSADVAEYVFGDEVTAIRDGAAGVDVEFARRNAKRFDLVIGADGAHSAVRRLAFGPEADYMRPLGYYYALAGGSPSIADLETRLPDGRAIAYAYNAPGRLAVLGGQKAPSLFVFKADRPDYDRHDTESQLRFLESHLADAGWRVDQMLQACREASDFYLDALVRTRMSSFTRGRVALVGDAGYANTLGGFGTGLALIGAYVLAGELVAARGDHGAALTAYDARMRKPTKIARSGNAGPFLAPPTRRRIQLRDWSFASRPVLRTMMWMADKFATDDALPAYDLR